MNENWGLAHRVKCGSEEFGERMKELQSIIDEMEQIEIKNDSANKCWSKKENNFTLNLNQLEGFRLKLTRIKESLL